MEKKVFSLQQFAKYLNVSGVKDDDIHVVHYANETEQRLKSDVVHIDFYESLILTREQVNLLIYVSAIVINTTVILGVVPYRRKRSPNIIFRGVDILLSQFKT